MGEQGAERERPRGPDGARQGAVVVAPAHQHAPERGADGPEEDDPLAERPAAEQVRRVRIHDQPDAEETESESDPAPGRESLVRQQDRGEDRRQDRVETEDDGADGAGRVRLPDEQQRVRQTDREDAGGEDAYPVAASARAQFGPRRPDDRVPAEDDRGDVEPERDEQQRGEVR